MIKQVPLTSLIAPSFYDVHRDFIQAQHTHYWLKGGRGSTKSSFASVEIVLGIMADPQANATVIRKVGETLRDSAFEQYLWAIDVLGVSQLWHETYSPLRLIYIRTGQRIVFKGADKPRKVKSSKFRVGYNKFIHYEETDEFGNVEDIRNLNQSLIRGGDTTQVIYSYNPPQSQGNWINKEVDLQKLRPDTLVHSSDYTSVNPDWLGPVFIRDAEHLKKVNPTKYEHEYMGAVTGTGAEVFTNITQRVISEIELNVFDKINRGLDFGYAADPLHYTENYYDKTRKRLYIFREIHKVGLKNRNAVDEIKQYNKSNGWITADSAEPRTIAEFEDLGLRISGAKKGPGSIDQGIKWLQDLEEIVIDPVRCPNTTREFTGYEIGRDGQGNLKGSYPDKDNHSIDATRYSLEDEIRNIKWLY